MISSSSSSNVSPYQAETIVLHSEVLTRAKLSKLDNEWNISLCKQVEDLCTVIDIREAAGKFASVGGWEAAEETQDESSWMVAYDELVN